MGWNEIALAQWERLWLDPDYDMATGRYYEDEEDEEDEDEFVDDEVDDEILESKGEKKC